MPLCWAIFCTSAWMAWMASRSLLASGRVDLNCSWAVIRPWGREPEETGGGFTGGSGRGLTGEGAGLADWEAGGNTNLGTLDYGEGSKGKDEPIKI